MKTISASIAATAILVACVQGAVQVPNQHLPSVSLDTRRSERLALKSKRSIVHQNKRYDPTSNDAEQTAKTATGRGGAAVAVSKDLQDKLLGTLALAGIEKLMKVVLKELDIKFPPMLAGCLTLFASLLVLDMVQPSLASSIATFLTPGTAFLAKWFPMFFVPGLVLLPLAPSVGGTLEITKMLGVVVFGLVYSMISVAAATMFFRGGKFQIGGAQAAAKKKGSSIATRVLPYSKELVRQCGVATAVVGVLMLVLQKSDYGKLFETACLTLFTMTSYMWAARLPASFVKIVHPLVTSCVLILTLIQGMSIVMNRDFHSILRAYKVCPARQCRLLGHTVNCT